LPVIQEALPKKTVSKSLTKLKKRGLIKRYKVRNRWEVESLLGVYQNGEKATSGDYENCEKSITGGISKNIIESKKTQEYKKELGQAQPDSPPAVSNNAGTGINNKKKKKKKDDAHPNALNNTIKDYFNIWQLATTCGSEVAPKKLNLKGKQGLVWIYNVFINSDEDPCKFLKFVISNWGIFHNNLWHVKTPTKPDAIFLHNNFHEFYLIYVKYKPDD
jgi:DNA-binding Lrp family transcriptional regulator